MTVAFHILVTSTAYDLSIMRTYVHSVLVFVFLTSSCITPTFTYTDNTASYNPDGAYEPLVLSFQPPYSTERSNYIRFEDGAGDNGRLYTFRDPHSNAFFYVLTRKEEESPNHEYLTENSYTLLSLSDHEKSQGADRDRYGIDEFGQHWRERSYFDGAIRIGYSKVRLRLKEEYDASISTLKAVEKR